MCVYIYIFFDTTHIVIACLDLQPLTSVLPVTKWLTISMHQS